MKHDERLRMLYETKTPTFLKIKYKISYRVLNGHIREIKETYILFEDIKLGVIPILKSDILIIDKSEKRGIK